MDLEEEKLTAMEDEKGFDEVDQVFSVSWAPF